MEKKKKIAKCAKLKMKLTKMAFLRDCHKSTNYAAKSKRAHELDHFSQLRQHNGIYSA